MQVALVIIPTYNEKDNAEPIARAILETEPHADILFVDDTSPDGTGEILDRLTRENSRIHVLHRVDKLGLGRAYLDGFRWALARGYEFILEMDADFSHNPRDISILIQTAVNGDLVLGSRYLDGIRVINWPLSRLILSRGAGLYVRWITGMPFTPTGTASRLR